MRYPAFRAMRALRSLALVSVSSAVLIACNLNGDASVDPPTVVPRASEQEVTTLQVSLVPETTEVALEQPISVRVSVYNPTNEAVAFLPMNTALEDALQADVFEVSLNGELKPYIGILAQRLPPTRDDFVNIEPGARLEQTLDIAQFYLMDQSGSYQISYVPHALTIDPALAVELAPVSVADEPVVINVR